MVQYHMEVGYICHTFYDYKLAHEHLMATKKCTGLQISLTGKPGERNLHENLSKIECISDLFCLCFLANYSLTAFLQNFKSIYYDMFIKFIVRCYGKKNKISDRRQSSASP